MNEKRLIIVVVLVSIAILGFWVYQESKPKPGGGFAGAGV
jgi:predicted negative regulator of RcsB-dependent stress response